MTVDQCINLLVTLTLVEMMVAIGLGVTLTELVRVATDWPMLARALAANYVGVPAAAVVLLLLFQAQPMVAAGFIIVAVCPGAPFAPPCTALAHGSIPAAVGLMTVLAATSAIVAPVLLVVLLPLLLGGEPAQVDSWKMLTTLLVTQLAPLCVGLAIRHWRSRWAERLLRPANLLSSILSVVAVVAILIVQWQTLLEIRGHAIFGMIAFLGASLGIGWLLGGSNTEQRKAMTLTTALRNVGVGLVIATGAFAGTPAITATVAYGLLEILGTLAIALLWGWRTKRLAAMEIRG